MLEHLSLSRSHALAITAAVAAVLLLGGRFLSHRAATPAPAAARAVPVAPARTAQLVVHVVGAVRRPGLYRLKDGSRVADAVAKAGGATPKADLELVNLAAPVADGTQIVVPRRMASVPGETSDGGGDAAAQAGPVHLNTATLEDLDGLPGVGPVTAQKIIDYRQKNGAFSSVDDLDAIPGIGPKRLEQLRELVAP
jgi:competence protein ComEA